MAIYDTSNALDRSRVEKRFATLLQSGKVIEVTEFKPKRTSPQNRYLHLVLGLFAIEVGHSVEFVKQEYFKRLCNRDLFVNKVIDKYAGEVEVLRSSKDLNSAEMTTAIERFRNWASEEGGIYIPAPHEEEFLAAIEQELNRQKLWR
jgi:hypothetical protein